jgi:hypothetical protein
MARGGEMRIGEDVAFVINGLLGSCSQERGSIRASWCDYRRV